MNARTLPASSRLCSCWTTSSMCSLDIPGNFTASRSTTSASARNSSLTPIGKVSALQATPVKASQFAFRASRNGQQNDGGRLAAHVHPSKVLTGEGHVPRLSVRVQPSGAGRPVPSLRTGPGGDRTVLNPPLFRPEVAPFLPPGLPLWTVDGGQNGQCYGNPKERGPQHKSNFQLSAHTTMLGPGACSPPPGDPHLRPQIHSVREAPAP